MCKKKEVTERRARYMGENKGGRKKGKMCKEKGVAERRDGYMGETKSVS